MTRTALMVRGASLFRASCRLYSHLLLLYPSDLYTRYGDEMQWVFRKELKRAIRQGWKGYIAVWLNIVSDTTVQVGPLLVARVGIVSVAVIGALAVMLTAMSFSLPARLPELGDPCLAKVHASSNGLQPTQTVNITGSKKNQRRVLQDLSQVSFKETKR